MNAASARVEALVAHAGDYFLALASTSSTRGDQRRLYRLNVLQQPQLSCLECLELGSGSIRPHSISVSSPPAAPVPVSGGVALPAGVDGAPAPAVAPSDTGADSAVEHSCRTVRTTLLSLGDSSASIAMLTVFACAQRRPAELRVLDVRTPAHPQLLPVCALLPLALIDEQHEPCVQISGKEWLSVSNVRRLTTAGIAVGSSEREVHLFALSPTLGVTSSSSASTLSTHTTEAPPPPAAEAADGWSPFTSTAAAAADTNGSSSLTERTSAGGDVDDRLLEPLFTHRLHGAEDEVGEAATGAQVGGAHVVHVLLNGGELPLLLSGAANGSLHLWRPRLARPE